MFTGEIQWFGGFNKKKGIVNNYGFIKLLGEANAKDIYVDRRDVPLHLQELWEKQTERGEGVCVKFNIELNSKGKEQAFNLDLETFVGIIDWFNPRQSKGYIKWNKDSDVRFLSSESFNSGELVCFAIQHKKYIDKYEAIQVNKINIFTEDIEIIRKCVNSEIHKISQKFIAKYVERVNEAEFLTFFINKLIRLDDSDRLGYWEQIPSLKQKLEYKGLLWDVAPKIYKIPLIEKRYNNFLALVKKFNNSDYPYANAISANWRELYKLDSIDQQLVDIWKSGYFRNQEAEEAKMISARGAEKLVQKFYTALGYQVEDIAAHQITKQRRDWELGDIKLGNGDLIDVKNARTDLNSNSYSEFCVPKFKQTRFGENVRICAVLSPYLQKQYITGGNKVYFGVDNPQVLGIVDSQYLAKIASYFCNDDSEIRISILRDLAPKSYLPHWLFDYDDKFYCKQLEVIEEFRCLQSGDIPNVEELKLLNEQTISLPLFIASQRQLPQDWLKEIPKWQIEFIDFLINIPTKKLSLPYLFLSILKHFLLMLSRNVSDYSPLTYLDILCVDTDKERPLMLHDPLNTIKDFCETLNTLWHNRYNCNLTEFKYFKFSRTGILQGKKSELESSYTTLLAYCGGKVENKKYAKCGCYPLIFGKNETCSQCKGLVCHKEECQSCRCNNLSDRLPIQDISNEEDNLDDIPF